MKIKYVSKKKSVGYFFLKNYKNGVDFYVKDNELRRSKRTERLENKRYGSHRSVSQKYHTDRFHGFRSVSSRYEKLRIIRFRFVSTRNVVMESKNKKRHVRRVRRKLLPSPRRWSSKVFTSVETGSNWRTTNFEKNIRGMSGSIAGQAQTCHAYSGFLVLAFWFSGSGFYL